MNLAKNIVLCGFMGAGKSTVGPIVASQFGVEFFDMDLLLVQREKIPVHEMFRRYKETGFRELEHRLVIELSHKKGAVIATGGGAMMFRRNELPLRQTGVIVHLHLAFDACYRRIGASDRPLVRANTYAQLEKLYDVRHEHYRNIADFEVDASAAPRLVAADIVKRFGLYTES